MRNFYLMTIFPLMLLMALPAAAEDFNMPKKDGSQGDKVVTDELVFYDMGGPTGATSAYYAGYTRFVPADESAQISITFEMLDLYGVAALYIYDGDISFSTYYADIPEGWMAKLTGNKAGQTFTSTTGSLSVLYHCKGSGSGDGWKAKVSVLPSKDQEWKELNISEAVASTPYPGKKNQNLVTVNCITDGGANPLSLTEMKFSLGGTLAVDKLTNVRLQNKGVTVGTAYPTASAEMTFSGEIPLRHGVNVFDLVADIADDASAGATMKATLSSAKVAGEQKVATPLAGNEYRVANMVFMPSEHKTYNVGDMAIDFYDDGGPEGKISENFSGKVTFVPTTPGRKVSVRFTSLNLFNTSTIGKNDVLKVYNGREADESNLLAVLLKEPCTIHSTADDGALTITFTSTTGVPTDGFEAVVEEFTPQAMEISAITATHPSTATVAAGESEVSMLLINLKAVNTEPPLTLTGIDFTSTSTAPLQKASVYSLGSDATSTGTLIGSQATPGATFSIAATSPVTLNERDNYFLLTYDVASTAVNEQTLDASIGAVKCGTQTISATDGNPDGERLIRNIIYSKDGTQTFTINGDWEFVNSPSAYSYYSYDTTNGDQITTLVPATPWMVVELDFTKFNVNSSNSSYSTPATFKVINGKDANGPVLWEMTYDTRTEGPGRALRGSSVNGALTVVFNSGSTRGTTSSMGFAAKVREYKSHTMEVTSIKAVQNNSGVIRPGAVDQEIIGFDIATDGDLTPLTLDRVEVNLKGVQDIVKQVKLYSTGRSETFSTATPIGVATVDPASAKTQISLNSPLQLSEGDNYFWIGYDMAEAFASDRKVDASLEAVYVGTTSAKIDLGDPDGERLTKNIYYFEGGTKVMTVDDSLMFYDDGGPEGNYTTNSQGSVTFKPAEGKIIRFIFKDMYINTRDNLYIYDGSATEGDPLMKISGEKLNLTPLVSTADDGALTVVFNPERPYNRGWDIEVQAFVPQPLAVKSVEATPVNDLKLLRGSVDNKMLKIAVEIGGDKGNVALTSFDFATLESDLSALQSAKLWYTGDSDQFATFEQYGATLDGTSLKFTGEASYKLPGTYYYWLTYDVAPAAVLEAKLQARLTSVTANGETVAPAEQNDALVTVREGKHGTYTVGTSGAEDYLSITEAINALGEGIDGPIELLLSDGNYNELVSVPQLPGSSPLNTVTMRSASGKRDNVVITYATYTAPSNYSDRYGVFTLNGVDYFTLRDVTIKTDQVQFPGVVFVRNESRHNTVDNCVISMPKSSDSAKSPSLVYMYSFNEANKNNDYLTVENSLLDGGYTGVNIGGTSYVALPTEIGARIIGNKFINQGSKGVYISSERDFTIADNTIITDGEGCTSSYSGMDMILGHGKCDVNNNIIKITNPKSSCTGIYIRSNSVDFMKEDYHRIYNNEVNISGITSAVTGVRFNTELPNLAFVHNTIRLRGANANSYGAYFNGALENGLFANNIVQNEAGGMVYGVNRATYLENIEMRGNVAYTSGEVFAYVGGDKTSDEWKELAVKDAATIVEQTPFLSDEILEPAEMGSLTLASPIEFVTTDLNGSTRDTEHPTSGAYEYALSTGAPEMIEGMPMFRSITHEGAEMDICVTLTGVCRYEVVEATAEAPSVEALEQSENSVECRKGRTLTVELSGLNPKTEYKVYYILESLRGIKSETGISTPFTTTYFPTTPATFESTITADNKILDGTFSFTGFELIDISDGVGEEINVKAAQLSDEYGVVMLTNAENLPLEGFFVKNSEALNLKSLDDKLGKVAEKTVAPNEKWIYCDLRDMGQMTYLEMESEGDVIIDNFGGNPLPLTIKVNVTDAAVAEGATTPVSVEVAGGVQPYSYQWSDAARRTLGEGATLDLTPAHSANYGITVTDARESSASSKFIVKVLGHQYEATFDDLYLDAESYWRGDVEDPDYMQGSFFSGSFEFNNLYMADWDSWAFFAYANSTSNGFEKYYTDQYNASTGGGHDGSANYGVAFISEYMGHTEITLSNTEQGETVEGCWFTNSAWVVDAINNGDGYADAFGKDDKLTLTITGIKADGSIKKLDFVLADYSAVDERDRWYLDTWQWCDLKPLGEVVKLRLSMSSTKNNYGGMTTPAYVCLDNLGGGREVTVGEPTTVYVDVAEPVGSFSLVPQFSFDPAEATVSYSVEGEDSRVTLENDMVYISGNPGDELILTAHATQRGKHEYVNIPVNVDSRAEESLRSVDAANVRIYPNPASAYATIDCCAPKYDVGIYSLEGVCLRNLGNCMGKTRVDVGNLPAGTYIVRLTTPDADALTLKLIVVH